MDLARRLGVPFAVVPCCVYPALFPSRRQRNSGHPVRAPHATPPPFDVTVCVWLLGGGLTWRGACLCACVPPRSAATSPFASTWSTRHRRPPGRRGRTGAPPCRSRARTPSCTACRQPPSARASACAACLGPHGDAAAGGWVAAGLGDSARRRQPPRWRDPAGAAANPAATAAAAAAEEEDTAAAAAAAPAQSGDGAEEAAACVAYVAACTVQLAVYAAAGKWFPAVALLSAMARHPGPGRRRRPRPGRPRAGDPADGSTDGGPASGPARLGAATRRPDAACGWLAARACAASGEWRPALKVLNVLRRCVLPP